MAKRTPPWWQLPAVIAASVAGLTALGTLIVKSAVYITLPDKVEASEQKNQLQDDAILELKKSNEIWQNIYTQQQAPRVKRLWDDAAEAWYCEDARGDQWWADQQGMCE